jgi:hypothetical protein
MVYGKGLGTNVHLKDQVSRLQVLVTDEASRPSSVHTTHLLVLLLICFLLLVVEKAVEA